MGAFLASLRAAVLRVAVVAGGADTSLNETSVDTLFNLSDRGQFWAAGA